MAAWAPGAWAVGAWQTLPTPAWEGMDGGDPPEPSDATANTVARPLVQSLARSLARSLAETS